MSDVKVKVSFSEKTQRRTLFFVDNAQVYELKRDGEPSFTINVNSGRKVLSCYVLDDVPWEGGAYNRTKLPMRYYGRSDDLIAVIKDGIEYTWEINVGKLESDFVAGTSSLIHNALNIFGISPYTRFEPKDFPKRIDHLIY